MRTTTSGPCGGGIGEAKTGGNYVASLAAQVKAHDEGYSQVLWLDGVERKYIEEVGAMNIFFKINGKVVTPMLNGSILPGVTRATCIDLCKHWGMDVEERRISVDELVEAARTALLEEWLGVRHRGGHLPGRRSALRGRGHGDRRGRHRPCEPEALRHRHRHPDRQGKRRIRLDRGSPVT